MRKRNYKFIRDLFTEVSGGKYSSKKLWGAIILSVVTLTYLGDGFKFYDVNVHLFDSMLIAGTSLIGLTTIGNIFKRSSTDTDNTIPPVEGSQP